MSNLSLKESYKYAESHEWAYLEGEIAVVGITDYAQDALGDVVYVELPEIGQTIEVGQEVSVVESVKAASDIYSPVAGEVVEVNSQLSDTPELVNDSPYDEGWFFKVRVGTPSLDHLMDADQYDNSCSE